MITTKPTAVPLQASDIKDLETVIQEHRRLKEVPTMIQTADAQDHKVIQRTAYALPRISGTHNNAAEETNEEEGVDTDIAAVATGSRTTCLAVGTGRPSPRVQPWAQGAAHPPLPSRLSSPMAYSYLNTSAGFHFLSGHDTYLDLAHVPPARLRPLPLRPFQIDTDDQDDRPSVLPLNPLRRVPPAQMHSDTCFAEAEDTPRPDSSTLGNTADVDAAEVEVDGDTLDSPLQPQHPLLRHTPQRPRFLRPPTLPSPSISATEGSTAAVSNATPRRPGAPPPPPPPSASSPAARSSAQASAFTRLRPSTVLDSSRLSMSLTGTPFTFGMAGGQLTPAAPMPLVPTVATPSSRDLFAFDPEQQQPVFDLAEQTPISEDVPVHGGQIPRAPALQRERFGLHSQPADMSQPPSGVSFPPPSYRLGMPLREPRERPRQREGALNRTAETERGSEQMPASGMPSRSRAFHDENNDI